MVGFWWYWKGIIPYELLQTGQTIDSTLYCEQLMRLKQEIVKKWPEQSTERARPHTSLMTRQKLRELGWEVLMYPPCSPDLAPSDYHLFRSMQNFLNGVQLDSREACENDFSEFFAEKPRNFLHERNNVFTGKMGKGYQLKWFIFGSIKFFVNVKKCESKFDQKNEKTF